jgi:hypothetical protein
MVSSENSRDRFGRRIIGVVHDWGHFRLGSGLDERYVIHVHRRAAERDPVLVEQRRRRSLCAGRHRGPVGSPRGVLELRQRLEPLLGAARQ